MKYDNSIEKISKIVKDFLIENGGRENDYITEINVTVNEKTNPNTFGFDLGTWRTLESDNFTVKAKRELMRKLVEVLCNLINKDFKNLINYIKIYSVSREGGSNDIFVKVGWFEKKRIM